MNAFYYDFPLCALGIAERDGAINRVFFAHNFKKTIDGYVIKETPLIKKAAEQLREYFEGKRKIFNLPISAQGTEFQLKAWEALRAIPYGETRSYNDIAVSITNPKAVRAVGMANNRNPVVIIIPCHRVIGADGGLTGYAGGLELKKKLLELEAKNRLTD